MKKLFNKKQRLSSKTSILSLLKNEDNLVDKYNMLIEQIDDLKEYIADVETLNMSEDIKNSLIIHNKNELKKQQEEFYTLTKQIELIRVQIKKELV